MLLQDKRIFIVEDNPGNLNILLIYLESQGAWVKFDRFGTNTPAVIQKYLPIDIILMDLMLPKNASGFDIVEQIRMIPELFSIPIVAVSAADPDLAIPLARKKGFAGFISKPVSPHITRQIADVLAGKEVWSADSNLLFN